MVIELLGSPQKMLPLGSAFIEAELKHSHTRPWIILEAGPRDHGTAGGRKNKISRLGAMPSPPFPRTHIFAPALPSPLQHAVCEGRLFWIYAPESKSPLLAKKLLECGLFGGVLLKGLESFDKNQGAALWGRRWQIASEESCIKIIKENKFTSHLIWLHQDPLAILGMDIRVHQREDHAIILKGNSFFEGKEIIPLNKAAFYGQKISQQLQIKDTKNENVASSQKLEALLKNMAQEKELKRKKEFKENERKRKITNTQAA